MKLTNTKKRAIVTLFFAGFSPREVARVFKVKTASVIELVRQHANGRRW